MHLYKIFPKSEKNKAIVVVVLVVLSLAVLFTYEGIMLHNRTIDQVVLEKEESIYSTLKDIILYSFTPYKERLGILLNTHKEIPKALIDQDRDTLYRLALPLYEELKRENSHLQVMHFHQPDGRSFLRMHKPEKFGDDLREIRPAVQQVHQQKTPLTCYEIGLHGAFYRIIQPVFYQGSYAGVLELGFDVHSILESLQKQLSGPLTTFLADRWQKVIKSLECEYLQLGKYVVIIHHDDFFKNLPPDQDISGENAQVVIGGKSYLLHAYPIFEDFQGSQIGGFVVLQDLSQVLLAKKHLFSDRFSFPVFS